MLTIDHRPMTPEERDYIQSLGRTEFEPLPSRWDFLQVFGLAAFSGAMIGGVIGWDIYIHVALAESYPQMLLCSGSIAILAGLVSQIVIYRERHHKIERDVERKRLIESDIASDLEDNRVQIINCTVSAALFGREGSIFLDVGDGKTIYLSGGFGCEMENSPTSDMRISISRLIYKIERAGETIQPLGKIWGHDRGETAKFRVLSIPFKEIWTPEAQKISLSMSSSLQRT